MDSSGFTMLPHSWTFQSVKLGTAIYYATFLPPVASLLFFEIYAGVPTIRVPEELATARYDHGISILYVLSALFHFAATIFGVVVAKSMSQGVGSPLGHNARLRAASLNCGIVVLVLYVIIMAKPAIDYYSHRIVYAYIAKSEVYSWLFVPVRFSILFPVDNDFILFYAFSLLPFGLMAIAFYAISLLAMSCGVIVSRMSAIEFSRMSAIEFNQNWRLVLRGLLLEFRVYFLACCLILVTSTASTAVFLRLGVSLEANPDVRTKIDAIANAMAIHWGGVFTLMLMSFLVIPAINLHRCLTAAYDRARITISEDVSFQELRDSIFQPLFQPSIVLSTLMPLFMSMLSYWFD